MIKEIGEIADIDYGNLTSSKRQALDQKAYSKYYNNCWIDSETDEGYACVMVDAPLTFNSWYGTESHKRYITLLLRKKKLEKIQNTNSDNIF